MLASQVYIVAAIAVLAVIAVFMYLENRHRKEKVSRRWPDSHLRLSWPRSFLAATGGSAMA